jgi:hypothetical protein
MKRRSMVIDMALSERTKTRESSLPKARRDDSVVEPIDGTRMNKTGDILAKDLLWPSLGEAMIDRLVRSKKLLHDDNVSAIIKSKAIPSQSATKYQHKETIHQKPQALPKLMRASGSAGSVTRQIMSSHASRAGKMTFAEVVKSSAPLAPRNGLQSHNGTFRPQQELAAMKLKYNKLLEQHTRLKKEGHEKDQKLEILNRHLTSFHKVTGELQRQLHNCNQEAWLNVATIDSPKQKDQIKSILNRVGSALRKTKDQNTLFSKCKEELAGVNTSPGTEGAVRKRKDKRGCVFVTSTGSQQRTPARGSCHGNPALLPREALNQKY